MENWSEQEIFFIIKMKESSDLSWSDITDKYNEKFKKTKSFEAVKKSYQRYQYLFSQSDFHLKALKQIHNTKKNSTVNAKENKSILDMWMKRDDLLDSIKNMIKTASLHRYKVPAMKKASKERKNMTLEVLFSDVHYGKYIDSIPGNYVDLEVIRTRVRMITDSVIKEIHRESKSFNVEKVILAMLGDIIENADFHGKESTKACEFSTSRQVQEAINSIFHDFVLPIAMTGIKVHIEGITGNHDRIDPHKTYVKPGEDNLSYIIYSSLKMLCEQSGLKNVSFNIIDGLYSHVDVYGNTIVYEHGDELKNMNRETLNNQLNKRQAQIGKVVHFFRIGHWHEPASYGQGKIMVNGSVPGQDSYAESKGFCSEAVQILNYYVETKNRNTCFFRSFPIYLQSKRK